MNEYIKVNPIGGGDFIPNTEKGAVNGVATLDGTGKIPVTELPSSVMEYQGAWNAFTNSPALIDGTGNNGDVYRVSVAGTQNLGSGPLTFDVGDFAIYNGTIWQRSPAGSGGGATTALDNLAAVAINTSLVSDTNNNDDLGTSTIGWKDLYLEGSIKDGTTVVVTPLATGCAIRGTTTNDNAAAGFVGEVISSEISFIAAGTSGQAFDATSISLTEGDWDIFGSLSYALYDTTLSDPQNIHAFITQYSGNDFTDYKQGINSNVMSFNSGTLNLDRFGLVVPPIRMRIPNGSIINYYLKGYIEYTAGNPLVRGIIWARRSR